MKAIKIHPSIEPAKSDYHKKSPSVKDVSRIISEDAYVHVDGKVVAVYKRADFDLKTLKITCNALKFETYIRTSGLVTQTLNINASPRNGLRTDKCQLTKFYREQINQHSVFLSYARLIARSYLKYFRKAYSNQIKNTYIGKNHVPDTYRIAGTPFTSGVINKNTALGYHRDSANTKDGISCMLILKRGVAGGQLILPELDIGFECQDGYMLLFDGQKYLHGVTPILNAATSKGFRYTVVYYNNQSMALCLPPEEEVSRYKLIIEKQSEKRYQKNVNNER